MRDACLIYNPRSGRQLAGHRLEHMLQLLRQGGWQVDPHATQGPGDAERLAREAVSRQVEAIWVAGGDGTLHEVVNGMCTVPHPPALGIIPAGTSNNLARALQVPLHYERAIQEVSQGQVRLLDVGQANNRFFIHICAGGWLTDVSYNVPAWLKAAAGQASYWLKGLGNLAQLSPISLRMTLGDEVREEEAMLFLVANTGELGSLNRLLPHADPTDGRLDVLIIRRTTVPQLVQLLYQALQGRHLSSHYISNFQAARLAIHTSGQVNLNLDGEHDGQLPVNIRVLPQHLPILVPADSLADTPLQRQ